MHTRSATAPAPAPKPTLSSGAYILMSFPLGVLYFIYIVAGLALSIVLIPIFIGLPMLVGVLAGAGGIAKFERNLARSVLGRPETETPAPQPSAETTFFRRLGAALTDSSSYLNALLCLLKFPIGIINFVVSVTLVSVSLALIAAPAVYVVMERTLAVDIFASSLWLNNLAPQLTPMQLSFGCTAVGVVLLLISLSLTRSMARRTAQLTLALAEAAQPQPRVASPEEAYYAPNSTPAYAAPRMPGEQHASSDLTFPAEPH